MKPPVQAPAKIASAALFNGTASKMSRTPGVAGNRTVWTFSAWIKLFKNSVNDGIFSVVVDGNNYEVIRIANGILEYNYTLAGINIGQYVTTKLFRDPAAHYHILVSRNGTVITIEVNGIVITSFTTSIDPSGNGLINSTNLHDIGLSLGGVYLRGLMSEIYLLDGVTVTASDFGEYNEAGIWVPRLALNGLKIANAFGTNGFYLKNNGTDLSGNGNNYTETIMATDTDTPSNNMPRLNPLINGAVLSNANLQCTGVGRCEFGVSKGGIFYWEASSASSGPLGIIDESGNTNLAAGTLSKLGFRLDMEAGTLDSWQGGSWTSIATGLTGRQFPYASSDGDFIFGSKAYNYTPPAGYINISAKNIGAYSIDRPAQAFEALAYVGDGLTGRKITGLEFQPDLVWIKDRDNAESWLVTDSVRGANKQLTLNDTQIESAHPNMLTQFNPDGFTLGTHDLVNKNAVNYVAFCFRKSVKYGIDIVTYVGDGVAGRTVSHNLSAVPVFMIVKNRDSVTSNFTVYVSKIGNITGYYINNNSSGLSTGAFWNNTTPTNALFSLGASGYVNSNGSNHVAYLFAEVPGFISTFQYTGNNNVDGPFVFCGFKPAMVIIKRSNGSGSWHIFNSGSSSENLVDNFLLTDTADAEVTGSATYNLDLLSNGFKIRNTGVDINAVGPANYVGIAFAEIPLEYAHAV